ncbi:protein Aster-B isoform X4 [Rhipicephalus sanguineus]|uniref:protein Aster-B isoform X4 n=1 Tax=Rhipicephalus sanguineus TaxID=34632 RepID=UPI001895DC06|nr:protein Aster-B isoform X4 [Rhipicephalus sanguineus]
MDVASETTLAVARRPTSLRLGDHGLYRAVRNGVSRRSSPSAAPSPDGAAAVVVAVGDGGAPNGGENGCGIALPADAAMAAAAPRRIAASAAELQQPPQPTSAAATPTEEPAPVCPAPAAEASDRLRPRPAAAPPSTTPAVNTMAATVVTSAEPDAASNAESTGQRTRRRKKRKPEGSPTLQVSLHNNRHEAVRCPSPSSPSQSPQMGARSPCFDVERTPTSAATVPSPDASSENAIAVGDSQGSLDRASDSSRSSQPLAPPSLLGCPSEIGTSPRPSPEGTRDPLSRSLEKSTDSKGSNKMLEKKKKTSSWYNMLNPTYKSRSEDFKRLFKDLPETERLIVDYSCALQRDILVHGRLYVTQNFICFYANIFRWETNVVIRCKDVTSMTKEKTARVIPNAVQVCTDHEKHFFTSFGARDKTYLMLFRIWQNALMEQPMSTQELWQWVHYSYGDELGLTSDDDDYVAPPYLEDEARRGRLAAALKAGPQPPSPFEELPNEEDDEDEEASGPEMFASAREAQHSEMPTDVSDSSDTAEPPECPSTHEGRQILNLTLPMSVDQLFTLLFTGSRFFHDLLTSRKTYDVTESNWQPCPETGNKLRQLTYTVTLNHAMAKAAQTTETQILHKASRPGHVYAIDCDVQSTGVPYCDAFCVKSHYCLARLSDNRSRLCIYGCVRYKKSVWGLVKAVIEKNTLQGLEGFCNDLESALLREAERLQPSGGKLKQRRRRLLQGTNRSNSNRDRSSSSQAGFGSSFGLARVSEGRRLATSTAVKLLLVLVSLVLLMNVALLYWLWTSAAAPDQPPALDVWVLEPPPQNAQEWVRLMSQREAFHRQRLDLWQRALHDLRHQLHTMESSLQRLQDSLRVVPLTNSSVPLPTAPSTSSGDL